MKQNKHFFKTQLSKNWSVLYILLIGILFLKPDKGFGQDMVLIGNITQAGSPVASGSEPLYLGSNEIGYLITTGSTATNLNSFKIKLWNSQGMSSSSFSLRVREVGAEPGVNVGDPVTYTVISTKYVNTVSQLIDNSLSNLASSSNTLSVFPTLSLSPNSKYFISIQNSTTQSVYWLQSDTVFPLRKLPGWTSQGAYTYFAGGFTPIPASNQTLFFELLGSLPNASVSTKNVTAINYDQTITAESGGISLAESGSSITAKGICWSTSTSPTIADSFTNDGAGTGEYTSTLTNLLSNTKYYVRAYVTDGTGTYYGSETSFSTNRAPFISSGGGFNAIDVNVPENTTSVTTVQATDADVPAQILTYSINGGADASKFLINSASGVLNFVSAPDFENPTDADTNNSYIVSVQVTDNGNDPKSTTQTIIVTVTNTAENPIVTNASTSSVGITGAVVAANVVTDGGGGAITERGFVYALTSANSNPSLGGLGTIKVTVSGSTGDMVRLLSGLTANTGYSAKAFATNVTGTSYSSIFSFTTKPLTGGPSISYETPIYLQQNTAISTLFPSNVGSAIPGGTYQQVNPFAGTAAGYANDTGSAAQFKGPQGMVLDSNGTIYVADIENHRIRKITPDGVVSLIAGSGYTSFGYGGDQDNATGSNARFNFPSDLVLDKINNCLYVSDKENHKIKKISLTAPYPVTTFAGSGTAGVIDGSGIAARFNKPQGIAIDPTGTYLYIVDRVGKKVRRITISTAEVTTIAGAGTSGSTDNTTGTLATFNEPVGIIATADFLYVADFGANKIRKIATASPYAVTTVAGSGTASSLDGTGTAATFDGPFALELDGAENLFLTEYGNKIRKITPGGVVTTIAGSGASTSVDGIGTAATFNKPAGIVINPSTSIAYVSEYGGNRIRTLVLSGYIVTPTLPTGLTFTTSTGSISGIPAARTSASSYVVTGNNYYGSSITNLNITVANVPTITTNAVTSIGAITAIAGGNVTDNGGIALIEKGICWSTSSNPTITNNKIVNNATSIGDFSENLTGLTAETTYYIRAYATTALGTVYGNEVVFTTTIFAPSISYATTTANFTVNSAITPFVITNSGGTVNGLKDMVSSINGFNSQFIGVGYVNGPATTAQFSAPMGIAVDSYGTIYVADRANNAIRKITTSGVVSTFAGSTTATGGNVNGNGTAAKFQGPFNIAIDANNNLYVTELNNNQVRKIDVNANVTTVAGATSFSSPASLSGITIDANGNLYVTEQSGRRIRKITPTGVVSIYAGSGITGFLNGDSATAQFGNITGIAIDAAGNLYVADTSNKAIRKISPTGVVSTFAGGSFGYVDGLGTAASFSNPIGVCFDMSGNLIVSDNAKFRKIAPNGLVTTISNGINQSVTDGPLISAEFSALGQITIDSVGNIYVADTGNHKIRKISALGFSITPELPQGLVLNENGSISGTPTVASPATNYVITATNAGGSSSTTISIAVTDVSAVPTWTGTEWINGPVATNAPAIIEGNYTSAGNLTVGELTVKNNAVVVFQSGHNLTVNGKLTVENGSNLTLESNANLLQTTNVANSGTISIKRDTAPLKLLDYVLWSSPVTGQQLQSYSPLTLSNRFYTYNSATNVYNAVTSPSADSFASATGYLIRMPNNHPTTPTIWTGTFTGIPNNGNVNLAVTSGTYNTIGNPYPSTLDTDAFIDANGITEALYFWRKTNNSANPSYATYTKAGGVGTANSADPNGLIPNGVIQVGQGFIAKATSNAISFTNAMRTATNGNQFLRTKKTDKSRIWLNLTTASGFFSQAMVAYIDGATSGIDAAIDGRYFNDSKTAVTSIVANEEFTIQGRGAFDTSDVVPLGFKTETAGNFSLAIDHTDGLFAAGQKVFLKDNLTNTLHDLSTGSYAFTTEAGVFNTRFEFRYQQALGTVDNALAANAIMVYQQNETIKIDAGAQTIAGVKVYDISGRLLVERKKINATTATIPVARKAQVLLVHVSTTTGSVVVEKIIQ
nr:cadherin domain-containing protein [uncultured Flavobacterium sp.]